MRFFSYHTKEDGYTLAGVLIIIAVLTTVTGIILSGVLLHSKFIKRELDTVNARYLAEAAVIKFIHDGEIDYTAIPYQTTIRIFDQVDANISVRCFGAYLVITGSVEAGSIQRNTTVLVGEQAGSMYDNAIVLSDSTTPLNLTGSAGIHGDILTGRYGVRMQSLKGRPFMGDFIGQSRFSSNLTEQVIFDSSVLKKFSQTIRSPDEFDVPSIISQNLVSTDKAHTFSGKGFYLSQGDLTIDAKTPMTIPDSVHVIVNGALTLKGQIRLGAFNRWHAKDKIHIGKNVSGDFLYFESDSAIVIANGSDMSGQFYSSSAIILEELAHLRYPSSLYVIDPNDGGSRKGTIKHSTGSYFEGTVILADNNLQSIVTNENSMILIEENAIIKGSVNSIGRVELRGHVAGSVLAHNFYFYDSPTHYLNWIRSGSIDVMERPKNFTLPVGSSERSQYDILWWFK